MMIDMEWDDDIDNYCPVEDDDPCSVNALKRLINKSLQEKDFEGSYLEIVNYDFRYAFLPASFGECTLRIVRHIVNNMYVIMHNVSDREKIKKAISGLIRMAFSDDKPSMFSSLDLEDIIVFLSAVPRPDCFSIEMNDFVNSFSNDIVEKMIVSKTDLKKIGTRMKDIITICCTIGRMEKCNLVDFNISDFFKFFKEHRAELHISSDSDNNAVFVTRKRGEYHSSKKGHEIDPSEYPSEIIMAARWLIKEELKEETS